MIGLLLVTLLAGARGAPMTAHGMRLSGGSVHEANEAEARLLSEARAYGLHEEAETELGGHRAVSGWVIEVRPNCWSGQVQFRSLFLFDSRTICVSDFRSALAYFHAMIHLLQYVTFGEVDFDHRQWEARGYWRLESGLTGQAAKAANDALVRDWKQFAAADAQRP